MTIGTEPFYKEYTVPLSPYDDKPAIAWGISLPFYILMSVILNFWVLSLLLSGHTLCPPEYSIELLSL
jgi:hypothetical protein